jgi:hypothetical protein
LLLKHRRDRLEINALISVDVANAKFAAHPEFMHYQEDLHCIKIRSVKKYARFVESIAAGSSLHQVHGCTHE